MKYLLALVVGLLALSTNSFAAYQFNEHVIGDFKGTPVTENFLTFDGSTELYFNFDDHITGFGYYDLETGTMTQGTIVEKQNDDTIGYLGSFTEKDKIGIWVKTGYGKGSTYYTTTDLKLPGKKSKFVGTEVDIDDDDDDDEDEEPEVEFIVGTHFEYDRGDHEWELDGIEFDIIGPRADAPSGQPLPSAMATFIMACFIGYAVTQKQRKSAH